MPLISQFEHGMLRLQRI